MALKHRIDKLEDVPEGVRSFYEPGTDGKFFLQVEGMVPKAQIDEFRDNNVILLRENQQLKDTYKDVDVAKYRTLLAAEGKTPEQIEAAVLARVKQLNEEHQTTVSDLTGKLTTTQQQLNGVLVDGTLKAEAAKLGVLATALDDVVYRGRTVFRTEDGKLVAMNDKGEKLYDKDGTSPLAVATWIKDLKKGAPHLFEGVRGSGGQGNGGQGGSGGLDMSKASATQKIAAGLALERQGG